MRLINCLKGSVTIIFSFALYKSLAFLYKSQETKREYYFIYEDATLYHNNNYK